MGKYVKKSKKKNRGGLILVLVLVLAAVLLALAVLVAGLLQDSTIPEITPTQSAEQPDSTTLPEATETLPQPTESSAVILTDGLQLLQTGSYAGIYMEDGSDEAVADVMMVILENTGDQDIQLARIRLEYADFTAEFEVTNLPAGEKLVALEKNRHSGVSEDYQSASVTDLVYFPAAMSLGEDTLQITGGNGVLEVTNVSGEDITGNIYIYYKNSASDLLYGGITYRVEIRDGLPAGGSIQVISGHYSPQSSRVVMVDWGE